MTIIEIFFMQKTMVGIDFMSEASKAKKELAAITKVAKKAMMYVNL
jgi:hypothetical protein